MTPFARLVGEGMRRRGLGLRGLCREAGLDPSFFSKVLSGKRSPPSEEAVLRRLSRLLGLDAAELIVSAGRIPSEWEALWKDPALFRDMHCLATGTRPAPARRCWPGRAASRDDGTRPAPAPAAPRPVPRREDIGAELL